MPYGANMDVIESFGGTYRWLSNFTVLEYPIEYKGYMFKTTENLYQAHKALHNDDVKFISELTAGHAKRVGRVIEMDPLFETNKIKIMYDIQLQKYSQPKFKQLLLLTGNMKIIEGNTWHDNIWGICSCDKCGSNGTNYLGRIIMKIRNEYEL